MFSRLCVVSWRHPIGRQDRPGSGDGRGRATDSRAARRPAHRARSSQELSSGTDTA